MIRIFAALFGLSILLALPGCSSFDSDPSTDLSPEVLRSRFSALKAPAIPAALQARVDLGRKLFYDKRLSAGENTSCNSCHLLNAYGVDGHSFSTGHDGKLGGRNAPTVYNAALNLAQFWDGRARDLVAQAKGPILNPVEMGVPNADMVVVRIKSIPGYVSAFRQAFPDSADPVTFDHFAEAVAAFEQGLLTPSRWDRYLEGDTNALNDEEKKGLKLFLKVGCATCHAGKGLGGNSFQKLGYLTAWPDQHDLGRYQVTLMDRDRLVFKVPTLRNIEKTGPYFHDGQIASLNEAVRLMAKYQCGENLRPEQVGQIVSFLKSLTGVLPDKYIAPPAFPSTQGNANTSLSNQATTGKGFGL
jgi:cytochrome c peroxidase